MYLFNFFSDYTYLVYSYYKVNINGYYEIISKYSLKCTFLCYKSIQENTVHFQLKTVLILFVAKQLSTAIQFTCQVPWVWILPVSWLKVVPDPR